MSGIQEIVMPKWGLAMQEGMLAAWHIKEGDTIAKGQEIADIETSKIANVFESPIDGVVRKLVTGEGETVPVAYLIAVIADPSVSDADVDGHIANFKDSFVVEDTGSGGPEPENVDTNIGRIRYLEAGDGDGTPVIFVHGFGGDYLSWMLNQAEVADGRKAYAIDLPGHGGSTKEVGTGDVASLAAAVAAFMDAMSINQAHCVGHSLGGAISLALAQTQQDRVASITALAPAGLGSEVNMDYIEGFIREKRGKKLRPFLEKLVHDPSMISGDMVDEVLKFKRLDGAVTALNMVSSACFTGGSQSTSMRDSLPSIPLQVIWGENDQILPIGHSDGLAGSIKITRLAATGHLPHMEQADQVNALIKEIIG